MKSLASGGYLRFMKRDLTSILHEFYYTFGVPLHDEAALMKKMGEDDRRVYEKAKDLRRELDAASKRKTTVEVSRCQSTR